MHTTTKHPVKSYGPKKNKAGPKKNKAISGALHRTEVVDDGKTLICNEAYIRKTLLSYFEKKGLLTDPRVIDNVNEYSISFPAEFILESPHELFLHAASSPNIEDYDVSHFIENLLDYTEYKIDISDKEYISLEEYYLYLLTSDHEIFECTDDGTIMRIDKRTHINIQNSMFGRYMSVLGGVSILSDNKVVSAVKRVSVPSGKILVDSLPVIPVDESRYGDIITRKRKIYDSYSRVMYKTYCGVSYSAGFMGSTISHYLSNRRVIVDNGGLKELDLELLDRLYKNVESVEIYSDNTGPITDDPHDNVLLTLYTSFAIFDLVSKQWSIGSWDNIKELEIREDAFDRLILDDDTKDMIQAITTMHDVEDTDIVDGKGSNAIFLLHGKPGSGKTLTAEAVSELLKKPLYKVSLGELGTNVADLEKTLNTILSLSERWDSIVLIDEADVFLEKRNSDNLERNAMVAVFLRLLEYYSGILFLTTNRAKMFDEAFVSRITLAVHYKEPERIPLWKMLLQNSNIVLSEEEVQELAKFNVNGRQVKSAINASKAFAKYKKTDVTIETIIMFLERSCAFSDYIDQKKEKTLLNE